MKKREARILEKTPASLGQPTCKQDLEQGLPSEFDRVRKDKIREWAHNPKGCKHIEDESRFMQAIKGGKAWAGDLSPSRRQCPFYCTRRLITNLLSRDWVKTDREQQVRGETSR
jgi:hypothetical protein